MTDSRTARKGLRLVQDETHETVEDAGRLRALADRASTRLSEHRGVVGALRTDLPALIRFVRAYVRGDYRAIPWKTLAFATGALVYFVSPIDLIPDMLLGPGFLDDAAVVAFVLRAIRDDLRRFEEWEVAASTAS